MDGFWPPSTDWSWLHRRTGTGPGSLVLVQAPWYWPCLPVPRHSLPVLLGMPARTSAAPHATGGTGTRVHVRIDGFDVSKVHGWDEQEPGRADSQGVRTARSISPVSTSPVSISQVSTSPVSISPVSISLSSINQIGVLWPQFSLKSALNTSVYDVLNQTTVYVNRSFGHGDIRSWRHSVMSSLLLVTAIF